MQQAQPAVESCPERQRLLASIKISGERFAALRGQEIDAVQNDETARLYRIWRDLDNAIALHDSLIEEFKQHVEAHGCRPRNGVGR